LLAARRPVPCRWLSSVVVVVVVFYESLGLCVVVIPRVGLQVHHSPCALVRCKLHLVPGVDGLCRSLSLAILALDKRPMR
jgi:hypothetical protein